MLILLLTKNSNKVGANLYFDIGRGRKFRSNQNSEKLATDAYNNALYC